MRKVIPSRAAAFVGAVAVWALLALPQARAALEAEMILHMAVQLPLLALVGVLLAAALRPCEPRWLVGADWLGLGGVTLALLATSYWMLPISLDNALANPRIELAKFLGVPLLLGLPLGSSWRRLPALGRSYAIANFISMVGTLGGLYLMSPARLCVFYVLDQQALAGDYLIALAFALALFFFLAALFGWRNLAAPEPFASETFGEEADRWMMRQ